MKRPNLLIVSVTILLVGITLDSFAGAATLPKARTESLLAAAGFQILTAPDARHQMLFLRSTPNTLERHIGNGEAVYTYVDQRGGLMYIGGPPEYQQYKRIVREVSSAERKVQISTALDKPWRDWNWTWKPWELWLWSYQQ
jgi:hypothetical protein